MEYEIVSDFNFQITQAEFLKKIRLMDDPDDEDRQKAAEMLEEALSCARPRFAYALAAIERKGEQDVVVEGRRIVSPLVRKNLDKIHRILLYVATCGAEAERWSLGFTDPLEHYWADEIKILILYQSIITMHKRVKDRYFPTGDMSQMSPGSLPEWPVTEQAVLFDLLGAAPAAIGVSLTPSFLMIPSKSVSGFFFASESHFENCGLCPMPNCPNRRAVYQAAARAASGYRV